MLRLLIFMNIMGSFFFILRKIFLPFEKNYMPPEYSVFLYRLNLMFFIIPLPTCLFYLRRYFDNIISRMPFAPFLYNGSHIIIHLEQNMSYALPKLNYYQILFLLLWIAIMTRKYTRFSAKRRKLREFNSFLCLFQKEEMATDSTNVNQLVHKALKELNIKKQPRIFVHEGMVTPHVSGIFRTTLCLPCHWDVPEQVYYMAIKHELTHIKHKDLLFQRIALIALIISWFNPILYLLCKNMENCEELAADASACKGASKEDRKAYQTAILDLSTMLANTPHMPVKAFGFKRKSNKFTIERILAMSNQRIYKHKTLKLTTTVFLSATIFLMSSIPALSYILPPKLESENMNISSIDMIRVDSLPSENDVRLFSSPQELESELYSFTNDLDFSKSAWYCVDENGVIYDEKTLKHFNISCNHNYIAAQTSLHSKGPSEGCSIDYYSAKRCTTCGYILETDHIATTTYTKCTH